MKYKYHCFISYSKADIEIASKLFEELNSEYYTFLDIKSIPAGDVAIDTIEKAQRCSLIIIILLSDNPRQSYFRNEEILLGINLLKDNLTTLVPIYINGYSDENNILKQIQGLFLGDFKGIEELKKEIAKIISSKHPEKYGLKKKAKNREQGSIDKLIDVEASYNIIDKSLDYFESFETLTFFYNIEIEIKNLLIENNYPLCLLFIDVDRFSNINKKFGQECGNKILKIIENIISTKIKEKTYFKKLLGDEFVLITHFNNTQKIRYIANRILLSVSQFEWNSIGESLYVTISIGFTSLAYEGSKQIGFQKVRDSYITDWLNRSILGLEKAKAAGGNRAIPGPEFLPFTTISDEWFRKTS